LKARLSFLFRAAISCLFIGWILRKIDWPQVLLHLRSADAAWMTTGSALTSLLIAAISLRWFLFCRQQAIVLPFRSMLALTWSGQFFNSVLPGSTGGDLIKIVQLCQRVPERRAAAFTTVAIDRVSGILALFGLAGVAFVRSPIAWMEWLRALKQPGGSLWLTAGLIGLAGVALAAWFAARHSAVWKPRLQRILDALKTSIRPSPLLAAAIAFSFAIHLLTFFIAYCFAQSLHLDISYGQILLIFPMLMVLMMLPVTVNGHGLRELILIFYFQKLALCPPGTVQESVIAFSALLVANDLLWSLPGGLLYFLRRKTAGPV
jgi:hypothetical protein